MARCFEPSTPTPHMLYFQQVVSPDLAAVTHVDGTARAQSVEPEANPRLHRLLEAVRAQSGYGVLCNTSLNRKGRGFINRMSDLVSVTTYYTDRQQLPLIQKVRAAYLDFDDPPVSTSVMVAGLGHEDFLVELTPIAVIPASRFIGPKEDVG